jgi:hypothetical protein
MKTPTSATEGPPEVDIELQAAIRRAMSGIRDPEEMRKACERMDRMREEIRSREGILDIGVPAIREIRGFGTICLLSARP